MIFCISQKALIAMAAVALIFTVAGSSAAANAPSAALTGQVISTEEGRMEGVLVSAKREGSTVTVTVVSDANGAPRPGCGANKSPRCTAGFKVATSDGATFVNRAARGADDR